MEETFLCPYKRGCDLIFAERALLQDGWAENVRIDCADGKITAVQSGAKSTADDARVDILLPAPGNLHSHTFQRAMAGLTEYRSAGQDSFWTWRDLMYRFLDHLTPDHIETIAAQAFLEMQEAGFAAVGEFHYVHHRPGGGPYDALAELSLRIFAAASETGIGLCHLPVLYSFGGAKRAPLTGGQLRFANDPDRFQTLIEAVVDGMAHLPADARCGVAPHSLRATDPSGLKLAQTMRPDAPFHIHIAEQPAEVDQIKAWLGARPVEWLMDNASVDQRWCLIHATHMTSAETRSLAQSGAVAGLCPMTEANLGDGPFNGASFLANGGAFGVGTDSNIRISLNEELRLLEYSQRLRDLSRNVLATPKKSTGETLYLGAIAGGAQALGRASGAIAPGYLADLVAIDGRSPQLCGIPTDRILDGVVFASGDRFVTDLWSAGRHCVKEGQHVNREKITAAYRKTMSELAQLI